MGSDIDLSIIRIGNKLKHYTLCLLFVRNSNLRNVFEMHEHDLPRAVCERLVSGSDRVGDIIRDTYNAQQAASCYQYLKIEVLGSQDFYSYANVPYRSLGGLNVGALVPGVLFLTTDAKSWQQLAAAG
jgi:hypothetical protein